MLAARSDAVHGVTTDVIRLGSGLIDGYPIGGPVAFVVLSGASAMVAFFSTVPLLPLAIYAWGEWPTFVLLWVGWMLGGAVSYLLGRAVGPRVAGWFAQPDTVARYEESLKTKAGFPTILVFQLALPSEIPGYVLGTLRYPPRTYALALALAELPYALSSVFLSGSFLRREYPVLIVVGVAAIALSIWALRRLQRSLADSTP